MRLGTILGRKAWTSLNEAAREKRREAEKLRKEFYDQKRRRAALNAAGFVPLSSYGGRPNQAWWGGE